jgi:hypothetical protein
VNSPPVEDIALQRNEVANMAWAIEKLVLGPSGRGVPRPWFRSEGNDLPLDVPAGLGTDFRLPHATSAEAHDLIWRLATPVAASWSPLVAVQQDANEQKVLRKARLLETTTDPLRSAKSQIMRDVDHDICDEEITRAGVQIRIIEQLARWHDGSSHIWRGREKRSWRGEAASGLRFDATTSPPPPA